MKKLLLFRLTLLASATLARATITINLAGGNIYGTSTATFAPTGCLLQLVVSTTDSIFTAPNSGSFTGGSADDLVIMSFALNNGLGSPGTFTQAITFALGGNLSVGDSLLLRWYPTLTPSNTTPTAGAPYGQFRVDMVENFSTIAWFVPADGSINDLNFVTMAQGGTRPESDGVANMVVALVPEPSTVALLGFSAIGLLAYSRRRKV